MKITIDSEFQDALRPLTPAEYANLEESLKADGCTDPLITWNGILIDGHHRLKICNEYEIEYSTIEKKFPNREAALAWIKRRQRGRRNLTPEQLESLIIEKRAEGKSTRAIASEIEKEEGQKVSQTKVVKVLENPSGEFKNSPEPKRAKPKKSTPPKPKAVTGRDGKTYPAQKPKEEDLLSEKLKDDAGDEVPEKAREAFETGAVKIEETCKEIQKIRSKISELGKMAGGQYIPVQDVEGTLDNAKNTLRGNKPTHICPECDGKKSECKTCKGIGFVTKNTYENSNKFMKRKFGK